MKTQIRNNRKKLYVLLLKGKTILPLKKGSKQETTKKNRITESRENSPKYLYPSKELKGKKKIPNIKSTRINFTRVLLVEKLRVPPIYINAQRFKLPDIFLK